VNLIEFEDLSDVVLVGHSYAGIVVTGVADRVPDRLSLLAYLDAGPVPDGTSFLDTTPSPEAKRFSEQLVAEEGDGWRLPMPSWEELETVSGASLEGLGDEERRLMRSRAVDQPFGTYTRPLRLAELPTGHWPMFSRPQDLAALLGDLAPEARAGVEGDGGS
jgi:pimeloyl-ACP methyl ester carboxylesterase